ncbi:glypican-6-like [Actinia tenebrosa]|uniref:Glypican-6-like n=1 Tax=Actinia tenebrosa TaxID=6105 RepID=A0A6P8H9T8_ACTTE|nr:glypican-6-like [Actinia tenebrosa]
MKPSRSIYSICLLSVLLACLCSTRKVKASCSKQLGPAVPQQPRIPSQGHEPKICVNNKTCCTLQMEGDLKQKAVNVLKDKVDRRLDGLKGPMDTLRKTLKVHFQGVIEDAKLTNLEFLHKQNVNISSIGLPLVTALFNQVEDYIDNPNANLTTVVLQFFRDAFPPLFNYATRQSQKFSHQYEKCLKKSVDTVQIFGKTPFRIAAQIEKVLRPMQLFLQSLSFASKTVNETKTLGFTKGCPPLLLQMKYCALCNGEDKSVKPCENYCIDVLKSCLATSVQLQSQWGLYFDALRDLSTSLSKSPNRENVLYSVFHELSLAIYQALPIHISDDKLKAGLFQACGPPQFGSGISVQNGGQTTGTQQHIKTQLKEVMTNANKELTSFKTSYEQLPLDVCTKERVSAPQTEKIVSGNCWNGTALGRYTGPVSSPLPSLEALPQDTLRITNLVQNMKTNIQTMKKYTIKYMGGEGSAFSGDSNVITGSGDCDDEDESCTSGESGDGTNGADNGIKGDTNTDFYLISTTPNPNEVNVLGGGQSNVKGSGKSGGTSVIVSSTLNLLLLMSVFVFL